MEREDTKKDADEEFSIKIGEIVFSIFCEACSAPGCQIVVRELRVIVRRFWVTMGMGKECQSE